ncbi:MAG TPA: type II toxin-antitoxin system RelE/ParE family toxin [Rhodanobacteraceae bacterium]|nr:type II toxin-antitoxin system RelE/ParE family toxin [Rhodanobacteraceae bacterium]
MTRFEVVLTRDAERDLDDLHSYIATYDSLENADRVLDRLLEVAETLSTNPDRGSVPKELRSLGVQDYRQSFFKPYRVIYRVVAEQVVVYLIADGRRDMQSLLARRLLGA